MKISIDGGALCSPSYKRFGTYTFTSSILSALSEYDKKNTYYIYSFCNKPSSLVISNNMFYKVLRPTLLWMNARVSIEQMAAKKDVYLALNQAIPLVVRSKVIGFSHGLSFLFYPRLYGYGALHLKNQLRNLMKRSDAIVVSSAKVRDEMVKYFPDKAERIIVLPFGIPSDFGETVYRTRQKFFLFVGTNHPIKNVEFLINSFELFRSKKEFADYELYLVGPFNILKKKYKNISVFTKVPREKLKSLYQTATAYLSASLYESYNLPVLEALSQKCPVIGLDSAIIPEFQKYCYVCENRDEFIEAMNEYARGSKQIIDLESLRDTFSWKRYVKGLTELYKI